MSKRWLGVALVAVAGLLAGVPTARAAENEAVATMVQTKGNVTFCNAGGAWYAAYPELRNKVLDHVRTGDESVATLEFDIGGRVGVNKNSEIEIVGDREAQAVGQGGFRRLVLRAGGIWAKVTRQRSELQVQTSGGVMGIKGTEFVVETTENGPTTLSVFEGSVEVRPVQGEPLLAGAGTKITFDPRSVPVTKTYENPEDLRQEVMQGWSTFNAVAGPILSATGAGGVSYYGGMALDVVMDPGQAARDYAASQVSSRVPMGGLFGGAISSGGRSGNKKPDFPTGLAPDQGGLGSERPTFRWEPVDKASGYVVLLSRDEDMKTIDWTARVNETATVYPENGVPLQAGRYFWRLIAVDDQGKPLGKASQTWFESGGWSPPAADAATP